MNLFKMVVWICILLVYPVFVGGFFCMPFSKDKKLQPGCIYLLGCLLCGALFSLPAFFAVRKGVSFAVFSNLTLAIFVGVAVVGIFAVMFAPKYRGLVLESLKKIFRKPGKVQIFTGIAFLAIAVLYVVRPFPMEPGFSTAERVVTVLDTGLLNGVNVMTGEAAPELGNWKEQLCNLPVFYACLCRWSRLSPSEVLFSVVPFAVLIAAFSVVSLYINLFFEGNEENTCVAYLLFAMITICGNAAYMNTSYGLLHFPYEAGTWFSCILLPFLFWCLLRQRNIVFLGLVLINAVCLVGVSAAAFVLGFMVIVYALATLVSFLVERRAGAWK